MTAPAARNVLMSRPQMRVGNARLDPNRSWFSMEAVGDAAAPKASLTIFGYIGQDTDPYTGERLGISAETLLAQLRAIPANADLDVTINSRGGDVFDGSAIHAFLSAHPGKVTVNIVGIAASAASLIAMAGNEIRIPANAWMMIHNPSSSAYGTVAAMQAAITRLETLKDGIVAAYAARNGKMDAEEIGAVMDAETWYTGAQAVEAGWADTLVEPVAATNLAAHRDVDASLAAYGNVPAELKLADAVEPTPPAAEVELNAIVEGLRAELAATQARLEAASTTTPPADPVDPPNPEPTQEPTAEEQAAAERARAEAAAAAAAAAQLAAEDADVRAALRRTAVKNGLGEQFDDILALGASTQQLKDLTINGSVAKAGTMSSVAEVVPPVQLQQPATPVLDPDKYYRLLNNRPKPGSK